MTTGSRTIPHHVGKGDDGSLRADLSADFRPVSLRALWLMMTQWGERDARQESYRKYFRSRWFDVE